MKKMFLALSLVLTTAFNVEARSMIKEREVTMFEVDKQNALTGVVAVVNVNYIGHTLKVQIFNDICGSYLPADGTPRCMAMPALIATYAGSYTSVNNGICGGMRVTSQMTLVSSDFQNAPAVPKVFATIWSGGHLCNPADSMKFYMNFNYKGQNIENHFQSNPSVLERF